LHLVLLEKQALELLLGVLVKVVLNGEVAVPCICANEAEAVSVSLVEHFVGWVVELLTNL